MYLSIRKNILMFVNLSSSFYSKTELVTTKELSLAGTRHR